MSRTSRSRMGPGAQNPPPSRSTSPSSRQSSAPSRREPADRPGSQSNSGSRPAPSTSAVPDGIDDNARAIALLGPFAALVPMAASGLVGLVLLWGSQSTVRGVVGFVLSIMSCPTLPIFGFPVTSGGVRWVAVIASSAILWVAVGMLAARRATSRAVAGWPEWRREWLRLAIGIWVGSFAGFAIAAIFLTVDF